jgi:hypothetical protein
MKKDRGKVVVRLGRRIGKNGLWHWVGAEMRDEIKIINIYIQTNCKEFNQKS